MKSLNKTISRTVSPLVARLFGIATPMHWTFELDDKSL